VPSSKSLAVIVKKTTAQTGKLKTDKRVSKTK